MSRAELTLPLTGGCFCGACRYELTAAPYCVYVCHCTDCQRQSGSAFNMTMLAPRADFRFTAGEPARFARTTAGGRETAIRFCGTCGSRLAAESSPETVGVRPGTLDDTRWLAPVAQFWTPSGHAWAVVNGVHAEDGNPADIRALTRAFRQTGPVFVAATS